MPRIEVSETIRKEATMTTTQKGSAAAQGPLWSIRARDWADIQEGPQGWGTPVYEAVLESLGIGEGRSVLDVGCGAGRFCRMAADRGASVAGIDAAEGLVEVARERTPEGDFRVGDMEDLPWEDDTFHAVTAFSSLQFAADAAGALREAARVARPEGRVALAVPAEPERSELAPFLMALRPLMPPPPPGAPAGDPLALSDKARLEATVEEAGLEAEEIREIECPMEFPDEETLVRGMLAAGPTVLAIRNAGEESVRRAALEALAPFRNASGGYRLENVFRCVIAA